MDSPLEAILKKLFSTRDVHPRDRFDFWHEVACKNLVLHDSTPQTRHAFQAEFRLGAIGDLGVILFRNTPMSFAHSARQAARTESDNLFVCRQVVGMLALEQNDRQVMLEAGGITLLDPKMPYTGRFSLNSKLLVLKISRRGLEARLGKTRDMTARSITGPEKALTSSFLTMLPSHTGKLDSVAAQIVGEQALDLIAVSVAHGLKTQRPSVSSAQSFARSCVRAAVEARLTDPTLDPQKVAAAAGISVRYANAILAQEGTSIMRLILARRLARCRSALEDPLQAHRTVSEVAFGWGFSDPTHFGRKFRTAYGQSPTDYRANVKRSSS